ncbi:ankyrin repeat domain-containing protein [Acidobacteria bacterium AB60]|nr:ankyrin repeat domain-containing protein [Acidobacteria bacterium AB60]
MDDDWYERERLHRAAESGDLEELKALLKEGIPINAFDEDLSRTPLHYAAIEAHIDAVRCLIEAGADVNAHEEEKIGETPLGAVAANCNFEMAKILIDAGADPTIQGWMTLTALDRSAERKESEGKKVHQLLVDTVRRRKPDWSRLPEFM